MRSLAAAGLMLSLLTVNAAAQNSAPVAPAPTIPAEAVAYLDAMRQALDNTPNVNVAVARARALGNEVQRARGRHLPTLNVNSGLASGGHARGATASVNLWAAGAIEAQVNQERSTFQSGRDTVRQACADALVQTSDAYVSALRADALVNLWTEHLGEYSSIQSMAEQIAAVDRGRRIDVDQVLTRKGLVQSSLLEAQNAARQTRLSLARQLGRPIAPVAASVESVADALLPSSIDDAVAKARAANPGLASARHDVQATRYAVDVARSARWPQLNLVANTTRDPNDPLGKRESVGLQLQWNVFNGGSDFYAERARLQAIEAANARVEEFDRALAFEVSQNWEAIASARERARLQDAQARPARAVHEANRELFRLGKRTILNILDSANDVHSVKTAAADARFEALLRGLRLHVLTGRLVPELRIASPSVCATDAVTLPPSLLDSVSSWNSGVKP